MSEQKPDLRIGEFCGFLFRYIEALACWPTDLEGRGKKVKYDFAEYQSIDLLILQDFFVLFFGIPYAPLQDEGYPC